VNVAEAIQLIREAGYRDKAALLDDKLQDDKIKHDTFMEPTTDGKYTGFPFREIRLSPNVTPLRRLSRNDPALLRLAGVLLHEADHALGHGELDAFGEEVAFYKLVNREFDRLFPGASAQQKRDIENLKLQLLVTAQNGRGRIAERGGKGYGPGYGTEEDISKPKPLPETPSEVKTLAPGDVAYPDSPSSVVREHMERIALALFRYRDCHGKFPPAGNARMVAALRQADDCAFTLSELNNRKEVVDPWGRPYVYRAPGREFPDAFDLESHGPAADGREGGAILCELQRR
jgi:hypothetical protein